MKKIQKIPLQKRLRCGEVITLLSLGGTGGIGNNRRPLENENPTEYADRCAIQWHRISVYPVGLGSVITKHIVPGSILYMEEQSGSNQYAIIKFIKQKVENRRTQCARHTTADKKKNCYENMAARMKHTLI